MFQYRLHLRRLGGANTAVGGGAREQVQLGVGHMGSNALGPQIEQPIQGAQRIGGEDGARRWRRRVVLDIQEFVGDPVRNDHAPAVGRPAGIGPRVVGAKKDNGRLETPQLGKIAPLEKIARRVVDPEHRAARLWYEGQEPVAPVSDVEVGALWKSVPDGCPVDALVT